MHPSWGGFTPGEGTASVRTSDTGLVVPVALGRFNGTDPDDGHVYADEQDLSVRSADPDATPDVVVTGEAAALDAWLWHRRDDEGITVEGDDEVAGRLSALLQQPLN